MAKTLKKKKTQPRSRVWTEGDVDVLLAWLDYCLIHEIDFKKTVVEHLKIRIKKSVAESQIWSRLYREWKYLATGSSSIQDLYHQGTRCLVEQTEAERERISRAVAELGSPPLRYRLRAASSALSSRSRPPLTASRSSATSTLSVLSSIATEEIEGLNEGLLFEIDSAGGRGHASSYQETVQYARESTDSAGPLLLQINTREQNDHRHSEANANVKEENVATGNVTAECIRVATPAASQDSQLECYERQLSAAKKRERRLQCEIFTLHNHLWAARQEYQELLHCHRTAATAQDTTSMLASQLYDNSVLRKQLLALEDSRRDLKSIISENLGVDNQVIRTELRLIEDHIADACALINTRGPGQGEYHFPPELDQKSHPLCIWASRVSGLKDVRSFMSRCSSHGIPESKLLRCLVAAITCGLVFESPISDLLAMDSPILDHYKARISDQYGPLALYQLDLLAWKSLMSDQYFESQVIPTKAQVLADQVYYLIEPILDPAIDNLTQFGPECQPIPANNPESDIVNQAYSARSELFEETFIRALQLKSKLFLSDKRYQWVFFKPDSAFNFKVMDLVDSTCDTFGPSQNKYRKVPRVEKGAKIRLCLFPALYISTSTESHESRQGDISWEDPQLPETLAEVQGLELVSRAVVLV
ncbi:hypothetical protein F5Y19DRAFT_338806 [Xylariaceae sp. FL1651]|nr:hypothetical protein F5Y19DRAFT_338806 [Xylariaceae sp. FL1651]